MYIIILGENFDLREKIETLTELTKRLKKQLKLYMKKLADYGGKLGQWYTWYNFLLNLYFA